MNVTLSSADLSALIETAVDSALRKFEQSHSKLAGQLGYSESEAASQLGVARHRLRDARLRGEFSARKLGKGFVYSAAELERWLEGEK